MQLLRSWPDHSERAASHSGQARPDPGRLAEGCRYLPLLLRRDRRAASGAAWWAKHRQDRHARRSNARSRGTGEANLWKLWGAYKDVAHLVTAAALICAEARHRFGGRPPGSAGPCPNQFVPFQMAMADAGLGTRCSHGVRTSWPSALPPMPAQSRRSIPTRCGVYHPDINVAPFPAAGPQAQAAGHCRPQQPPGR